MPGAGVLCGLFEPRVLHLGGDEVGDGVAREGGFCSRLFGRERLPQQDRSRGASPRREELLPRHGAPRGPAPYGWVLSSVVGGAAGGASGSPGVKERPC